MAEHTRIAFVDTETTGLDPDRHEIWEVAAIIREQNGAEIEYLWQLPVDLGCADAIALKIGGYRNRGLKDIWNSDDALYAANKGRPSYLTPKPIFADRFARLTNGAHLVGAVPSFDEERLRKLLRRNRACPDWHYHLVDVEGLIAGKLGFKPPWKSEDLGIAMGVPLKETEKHTALGDARWARDLYDAVYQGLDLHQTAVKVPAHRS